VRETDATNEQKRSANSNAIKGFALTEAANDEVKIRTRLATPANLVGETLNSRYQLLALLGGGATSSVFEALDEQTGQQVAIKILHAHLSDLEDVREKFRREALTATVLAHPNIVKSLDSGITESGQPFLVMDFAGNTNLEIEPLSAPYRAKAVKTLNTVLRNRVQRL